jgi:23S rRNA (cytosine1962-C5)-methyltransferase
LADPNSCRVVHSESDFLPALIVDKFSDELVMQCLSLGMERYKSILCELFMEIIHPEGIFERDDGPTRKLEGMDERVGVLCGSVPDTISMVENGIKLWVDVVHGQKQGISWIRKKTGLL